MPLSVIQVLIISCIFNVSKSYKNDSSNINSFVSLVNSLSLSIFFGNDSIRKLKSKLVLIFSFNLLYFLMLSFTISYDVNGTGVNTSENDEVISV